MNRFFLILGFICMMHHSVFSQNWSQLASVRVWATINDTKPSITLNWIQEAGAVRYMVFRRNLGSTNWGTSIANLNFDVTSYTDSTVQIGQAYEYRVSRSGSEIGGFGYLSGGIKVPGLPPKKSILLLIDARVKDSLSPEINTLITDLQNESWHVIREDVSSASTAIQIKTTIRNIRNNFPGLTTVFIIGHVAVPYSGNTAWDGHTEHNGAWPADTYYGDIDGNWTDVAVNSSSPARNENKNIPGDGKFDQSNIPSDLELEVGRVDFFNMPVFSKSEVQLLRNYLNKNHAFRTVLFKVNRKAIVADNFNFQGEHFGSTAYKSFVPFFGPDSVNTADYRSSLLNNSHLWSYGAGGGTYTSAGGISTSGNMATDSLRGIFTCLFGSYHGDWDSQNNFMRSSLGSGNILTCVWAGRPGYQFHHMALGNHIGFSTRLSINNNGSQYSVSPTGLRGTHMGLLGDPSLNMYPLVSPSNLNINEEKEAVKLSWKASPDASHGYSIYRKSSNSLYYQALIHQHPDLQYSDRCLSKDSTYDYLVCATKLETNGSGSFYMNSPGIRGSIKIQNDNSTKADFIYENDFEFIKLISTSKNSTSVLWSVQNQEAGTDTFELRLDCNQSNANVQLKVQGVCSIDSIVKNLSYPCSTPKLIHFRIDPPIKCFGDSTNIYIDSITGAAPFQFIWSNGDTTPFIQHIKKDISLKIQSRKNTESEFQFTIPQFEPLLIDSIIVKGENPGFGKGKILNVLISGGQAPYQTKLTGGQDPNNLPAGEYEMMVTDSNGCINVRKFVVPLNVSNEDLNHKNFQIFPNPACKLLFIETEQSLPESLRLYNSEGLEINLIGLVDNCNNGYCINIAHLPSGLYYLQFYVDGLTVNTSWIKNCR